MTHQYNFIAFTTEREKRSKNLGRHPTFKKGQAKAKEAKKVTTVGSTVAVAKSAAEAKHWDLSKGTFLCFSMFLSLSKQTERTSVLAAYVAFLVMGSCAHRVPNQYHLRAIYRYVPFGTLPSSLCFAFSMLHLCCPHPALVDHSALWHIYTNRSIIMQDAPLMLNERE